MVRYMITRMSFEGVSTRGMLVIFGVLAAGAAIFMATVVFPATNLMRETVIEETTVIESSGGKCIVDTKDMTLSSKTINGCDLPVGSKVKISYQKGFSTAELVTP